MTRRARPAPRATGSPAGAGAAAGAAAAGRSATPRPSLPEPPGRSAPAGPAPAAPRPQRWQRRRWRREQPAGQAARPRDPARHAAGGRRARSDRALRSSSCRPGKGNPPYGDRITGRAIDMIAPIGRGQRCLIVSPPKAGKTRILQSIAASIAFNHPEVGDLRAARGRAARGGHRLPAQHAGRSDRRLERHEHRGAHRDRRARHGGGGEPGARGQGRGAAARLDHAPRARLQQRLRGQRAHACRAASTPTAMQAPRQIFGAARKIEDGGSLTIVGTALIDTGSRMDQVIFEEFKGTGNSEIFLSRELAERRIYPAIDIAKSGTRKEEKLYPPEIVPRLHMLRRGPRRPAPAGGDDQAARAAEPLQDQRGDLRAAGAGLGARTPGRRDPVGARAPSGPGPGADPRPEHGVEAAAAGRSAADVWRGLSEAPGPPGPASTFSSP